MRMVCGWSLAFLTTRLLMFRMMSVTSSTTPGMVRDLVLHALDLDAGDGAAFQAGQQDAAQAVADGHAEAALERLGDELAVGVGQRRRGRSTTRLGSSRPRHRIRMGNLLHRSRSQRVGDVSGPAIRNCLGRDRQLAHCVVLTRAELR